MINAQTNNQATFNPQHYKSFEGALEAFFASECPMLGGNKVRQVLVNSLAAMVRDFYPETSHLASGQTPWTTVSKDAKGSYGKKIQNTALTPVVLTLVQAHDAKERAEGKKLREIKQEAAVRLFEQAYEQGGCMTNAEVALLLKISPATVSKYVRMAEEATNKVIPRRGSIHDMGPTLTHKRIIIHKLFIEKKSVQQTSRETFHSYHAIQRYIGTFKQVLLCKTKGMTQEEIAYAIKRTKRLVKEYEAIIDEYQKQGNILEQLMHHEVDINEPDPYYNCK